MDLWAATQLDGGPAVSSVRRRLLALSSFYRYCAAHDLIGRVPTQGVARPVVDPDYTATVGLDREQARALVAAADADTGAQALRTAAVVPRAFPARTAAGTAAPCSYAGIDIRLCPARRASASSGD